MQNAESDRIRAVKKIASGALLVPQDSLKTLSVKEGCRFKRAVFYVKQPPFKGGSVLKCFMHEEKDIVARERASKETKLAEWASRENIGAPTLSVTICPETTILAMSAAVGDLEGLLRSCQHLSYMLIKDLFAQAFRLATHDSLLSRGLVCADLKPANFLLYIREKKSCIACDLAAVIKMGGNLTKDVALDLRLVDFDPFFWSKTCKKDARRLNEFFLLANSVLWKAPYQLGAYFPENAVKMASAVKARDPSLLKLLEKHPRILHKGPFHYSKLPSDGADSLDALLASVTEALVAHGFFSAKAS
jgi:hypothetical protein